MGSPKTVKLADKTAVDGKIEDPNPRSLEHVCTIVRNSTV